MTTYGAYNAGLPCKNRACKSHGSPHPNCQCYGSDMAKGGEVKSFCSVDRTHDSKCEYYADGGEVMANMEQPNPSHSVSAYLASSGLHGLLKMGSEDPEKSLEKYQSSIKRGHKHIDKHV